MNKIPDINVSIAVTTIIQGTKDLVLHKSLAKKPQVNQVEPFSQLQKYIQQEETLNSTRLR